MKSRQGQAGYALLLVMLILTLTGVTGFLTSTSLSSGKSQHQQSEREAMTAVRDALLGRALTDANRPGGLPCPDYDGDGQLTIANDYNGSACKSYVGLVPYKTLGIPEPFDADGNRLWYVLDKSFQDASTSEINSDTTSTLALNNASGYAFLIIAPGISLAGQTTRATLPAANLLAQYLDGSNATADFSGPGPQNFSTTISATLNDRILGVTRGELMAPVEGMIAGKALNCLSGYASSHGNALPDAAPLAVPVNYLGLSGSRFGRLPTTSAPGGGTLGNAVAQLNSASQQVQAASASLQTAATSADISNAATALVSALQALDNAAIAVYDSLNNVSLQATTTIADINNAITRATTVTISPSSSNRNSAVNAAITAENSLATLIATDQTAGYDGLRLQLGADGFTLLSTKGAYGERSPGSDSTNANQAGALRDAASLVKTDAALVATSQSTINTAAATLNSAAESARAAAAIAAATPITDTNFPTLRQNALDTSSTAWSKLQDFWTQATVTPDLSSATLQYQQSSIKSTRTTLATAVRSQRAALATTLIGRLNAALATASALRSYANTAKGLAFGGGVVTGGNVSDLASLARSQANAAIDTPTASNAQTALNSAQQATTAAANVTAATSTPVPWPSGCDFLTDTYQWHHKNKWGELIFFQGGNLTVTATGSSPVSKSRVVIAAGGRLNGQGTRPSLNVADYLEGANADSSRNPPATAPGGAFAKSPASLTFNDVLAY